MKTLILILTLTALFACGAEKYDGEDGVDGSAGIQGEIGEIGQDGEAAPRGTVTRCAGVWVLNGCEFALDYVVQVGASGNVWAYGRSVESCNKRKREWSVNYLLGDKGIEAAKVSDGIFTYSIQDGVYVAEKSGQVLELDCK